jgi:hypothetical protein
MTDIISNIITIDVIPNIITINIVPSAIAVLEGRSWGTINGDINNQADLKEALDSKANSDDLALVATSGDYNDLINTPTNVSEFVNDSGYLTTETDPVFTAWDKDYTDLINTPTNVSEFVNDSGYLTTETDPVFTAWDKDYTDLINTPTFKTINNESVVGSGNIQIDGVTDHTLLSNIGTNSHADIDLALQRLANTSGNNTGDQDLSGYQLALGYTPENVNNKATNLSNPDNILYPTTLAVSSALSNKQDTLVSGTNIKTINDNSILGIGNLAYFEDSSITKEPTGFQSPENVIISYNSTNRTITLTGTINAYYQGESLTELVSGWVSDPHPLTLDKSYFLVYNGTNFQWLDLSSESVEFIYLLIAFVSYGTNYKFAIRECHGLMNWQSHKTLHETIGTYRKSGGDISGITLNSNTAANRRPLVSSTLVFDEDLGTTNPAIATNNYTQFYLSGSGLNTFILDNAEIIPLSGNQPYYNQFTGGSWQQTLLTNNQYMCIWLIAVPVTVDSESQKYRYLFMQGQSQGTLSAQQALQVQDLNLGELTNLASEYVFIHKFIIRFTANNWIIVESTRLTGSRVITANSPASNFLSVVTTDATLTGLGTVASPLSTVAFGNNNEIQFNSNGDFSSSSNLTFSGSTLNTKQIKTTKQVFSPTGTTQTIDWNDGSIVTLNLASATGTVILTLNNPQTASTYLIKVIQGETPRNITFPSGTLQSGGGGVTYAGIADNIDIIALYWDGTNYFINVSRGYS